MLVHGSPKQRAIDAGETHATAHARLVDFLAAVAPIAAAHGVIYCLEPLGRAETALINTVAEAAEVVRAIDSPALRTMIDCSAAGATETAVAARPHRHLAADRPDRPRSGQRSEPARARPGRDEVRADLRGACSATATTGTVAVEPFDYVPDGPGAAAFAAGYLRGVRESLA